MSAEFKIYRELGALAWGIIASSVLGNLYGLMSDIAGGIEALQNAVMVLSSKETRFLTGVYCQDRYKGMTPSEAWADITIPEFQPLWKLINNLQSISLDARRWNFEWAYQSYRLVGYGGDSDNFRTNIGSDIVALCYPSIIGPNTVGILNSLTLNGGGSIGGFAPNSWEWDFEYDGNPDNFHVQATGKQTSHTYRTVNSRTVGLRVKSDGFAPVIVTKPIQVLPPQIDVSYPNGYEKMDIHFSTIDLSGVNEYTWNYGDGTPSENGRTKDHTYVKTDYYTARLTLTLDDNTIIQSEVGIFVGPGTRYIQGHTIYGNETWYSGGTYVLQGSIGIAQGGKLTIESGTQVEIQSGISVNVSGTLTANGVLFTARDQSIPWGGILFYGSGSTQSRLDGCTFEYSEGNLGGVIRIQDSSPTIKGCTIDKCNTASYGIRIDSGSPVIDSNKINGLNTYGILVGGVSNPTVTGNNITNNWIAIFVTYSMNDPVFSGNSYAGNSFGD